MLTPNESQASLAPESGALAEVVSPELLEVAEQPEASREARVAMFMTMGWLQTGNSEKAIEECRKHGIDSAGTAQLRGAFLRLAEQALNRQPDEAVMLYQAAGVDARQQLLERARQCFEQGEEIVGKLVFEKLGLQIPDTLWLVAAATHIRKRQEESAARCHASMEGAPPRDQVESVIDLFLGRSYGGVLEAKKYCEETGIEPPEQKFVEAGKTALDDEQGTFSLEDAITALRVGRYDFNQDPERRGRLIQRSREAIADADRPVADDNEWNRKMRRHYLRNDGLQGLALAGEHEEVLQEADRDLQGDDLELALRAYMAVGAGNPQAKEKIAECARKILAPSDQRRRRRWREQNMELAVEALLTPGIEPPPEAVLQILKENSRQGWEATSTLMRAFGDQSQSALREAAKGLKGVEGMLALHHSGDEEKVIQRMRQHMKRGALWEVAKVCELVGSVPEQIRIPLIQTAHQVLDELLILNETASQEESRWEFNREVYAKVIGVLAAFKILNGRIPQEKLSQLAQLRLRAGQADQAREIYETLVLASEDEASKRRALRQEQK